MKTKTGLETQLFYLGLVFLAVGAVFGMLYYFVLRDIWPEIPCVFYGITGFYCPGCGGTRAVKALLQGRILLSLKYHPLVLYIVCIGGGFMLTQGLHRLGVRQMRGRRVHAWRFHTWYLYGAVFLTVFQFLIKNALKLLWGITMENGL